MLFSNCTRNISACQCDTRQSARGRVLYIYVFKHFLHANIPLRVEVKSSDMFYCVSGISEVEKETSLCRLWKIKA